MSFFPFGGFRGGRQESGRAQRWDNFHEQHALGGLIRPNPAPYMGFHDEASSMMNTRIEMEETPQAHVYKAHLPGLQTGDVRVEVDDDRVLCITGHKRMEKQEQRSGWHQVEFSSGHYVQRLLLPHNSMVDHVKAVMHNGLLTVTVPKLNGPVSNRLRNVNISSHPSSSSC